MFRYEYRPPSLNTRIRLLFYSELAQDFVLATDAYGRSEDEPETNRYIPFSLFAHVYDRRVSETLESGTVVQNILTTFTIRRFTHKNQEISENSRVVYRNQTYQLVGPPLARGLNYLQLDTKLRT